MDFAVSQPSRCVKADFAESKNWMTKFKEPESAPRAAEWVVSAKLLAHV
jgi:hypothetical protein